MRPTKQRGQQPLGADKATVTSKWWGHTGMQSLCSFHHPRLAEAAINVKRRSEQVACGLGTVWGVMNSALQQCFLLRVPPLIWKIIPHRTPCNASQMLSGCSFKQMFTGQGTPFCGLPQQFSKCFCFKEKHPRF